MTLSDVIEAKHLGGYRVWLRFDDGATGSLDLSKLIEFTGVFAVLADKDRFAELHVNPELGTICWPNGADLAPEFLRSNLTEETREAS